MSYDVYLRINTGKEEHTVVNCGNYTSNVGKMYREAFPANPEGIRNGIDTIHDVKADMAVMLLEMAISAMKASPTIYESMNPVNGWGDYTGALQYLLDIQEQCIQHPACTVYLSA